MDHASEEVPLETWAVAMPLSRSLVRSIARQVKAAKAAAMLKRATTLKDKGNEALKNGDVEASIKHYSMAIRLCPTEATFLSNRSAAYLKGQLYKKALRDAKSCTEQAPEWAKGYTRLGASFFALDMMQNALEAYRKANALEPGNAATMKQLELVEARAAASTRTADDEVEWLRADNRKVAAEDAGCAQQ